MALTKSHIKLSNLIHFKWAFIKSLKTFKTLHIGQSVNRI